ncbi:MAG: hypothetical protein QJR02_07240 [Sinobacteraceae bacterium]|nr:hypothetical protein [Nevskiaceae bacterium]
MNEGGSYELIDGKLVKRVETEPQTPPEVVPDEASKPAPEAPPEANAPPIPRYPRTK